MPPVKQPPKPKDEGASNVALVLFAQNLEEIRRWYRGATYAGRETGHVVISERIFEHTSNALSLALDGKRWIPPEGGP